MDRVAGGHLTPLTMPPSLRERAGQLVASGFRGLTPSEAGPTAARLRAGVLSGVAIYSVDEETGEPKNVRSKEQLRKLIRALQPGGPIPIVVAVDAEGTGFYQQLRVEHGFPATVSPQELGEKRSVETTRGMAGALAAALASVGITVNCAPVVDLTYPGNLQIAARRRSFSSDPEIVAAHAAAFIRAHHEYGVLCIAKHFPGVGSAMGETHGGAVDVASTWSDRELEPYRGLIRQGLADAVMTHHFFHRGLDPDHSAAMSRRIATDLLRVQLGFEGLLVASTFEMESIWNSIGLERALILAMNAGVDFFLLSNPSFEVGYDERRGEEAVEYLVAAVERGEIAESRIDEACRRVLRFKEKQLALRAAAIAARRIESRL